jgi:hypothetical protein
MKGRTIRAAEIPPQRKAPDTGKEEEGGCVLKRRPHEVGYRTATFSPVRLRSGIIEDTK